MKRLKLTMVGAGSGFTASVAVTLDHPVLRNCRFALLDPDAKRLAVAERSVRALVAEKKLDVKVEPTNDLSRALDGADYVITSCEINRNPFWLRDIEIPERHGVHQYKGENGGPGGQIHAMRNICLFIPIVEAMRKVCPDAWLLNFTNPESYLLTYLLKHTPVKSAGFCHQVHGVMGVIAEQLGFEPGELQVISVGINHLNWMMDLRRRSTGKSYMKEFSKRIRASRYWTENRPEKILPQQKFSLEVFETFGMYPIGYDDHIIEYLPFFYERGEWEAKGFAHAFKDSLKEMIAQRHKTLDAAMERQHLMGKESRRPPFPRDDAHPYYREAPCAVACALETNEMLYLDACVGFNHGAAANLPDDAVVDRPALVIAGDIRSVRVGTLPPGPAEICRRQIALHEMVVQAVLTGDASLAVQALCLDPYVRSITQARAIWADYHTAYREYLPTFGGRKRRG